MGLLDQPGDLSRTPLAALLLELLNLRADGVLAVEHGGGTSRLWFHQGQPVGAQVASGFRPARADSCCRPARSTSTRSRAASPSWPPAAGRRGSCWSRWARSRARTWRRRSPSSRRATSRPSPRSTRGGYAFDASQPIPEWTRGIRISPLRTIIDALERPQAGELVTSALRPVALGGVRLASGYVDVAPGFGWDRSEQQLVARLEQPVSLEFFFGAEDGVVPERSRAILAGAAAARPGGQLGRVAPGHRRHQRRADARRRGRRVAAARSAARRGRAGLRAGGHRAEGPGLDAAPVALGGAGRHAGHPAQAQRSRRGPSAPAAAAGQGDAEHGGGAVQPGLRRSGLDAGSRGPRPTPAPRPAPRPTPRSARRSWPSRRAPRRPASSPGSDCPRPRSARTSRRPSWPWPASSTPISSPGRPWPICRTRFAASSPR